MILLVSCAGAEFDDEFEQEPEEYATLEQGLVTCNFHPSTGYRSGNPFPVTLVTADGMDIEVNTANAYAVMQAAAASQGVPIRVNSGFRTPEEQEYLYGCYVNCNCNSCNLAARPGYSNHQSGTALDLNTANSAVFNWLNAHGGAYGFARTVPSEPWHWEYMGGGPGGGPCVQTPPSCDRSSGPFTFSCDGTQSGMTCVNVNEPSDPDTWNDNFFCSDRDLGLRWSYAGPLADMDCTGVHESAEMYASAWADNFLCAPKQSPWEFSWSSAGPIAGRGCVHWNEGADPHSWGDNYVCTVPRTSFSAGEISFSMAGTLAGKNCVNVNEPSDPDTWTDNFFCTDRDVGMRWSYAGPIAGMTCTNVAESAEAHAAEWADNFLCVPLDAPLRFSWSSAGPLAGKTCVRWFEHADTSATWLDNWMCVEERVLSTPVQAPPEIVVEPMNPVVVASPVEDPTSPVTSMHLETVTGCSSAPSLMLWAAALLFRRRRS